MAIPFIEALLLAFLLGLLLNRYAKWVDDRFLNTPYSGIWEFIFIVILVAIYPATISAPLARYRPIWLITPAALLAVLLMSITAEITVIPPRAPLVWLQNTLDAITPANAWSATRNDLPLLTVPLSFTLIAVGLAAKWFKQRPDHCWRHCYYQLEGLAPNETGAIRCPECALLAAPLDAKALSPSYRFSMWLLTANILTLILLFLF